MYKRQVLDAIANTLPPAFYEELNGGILLLPEAKRHPKARGDDLYICLLYTSHNYLTQIIVNVSVE